jgi:hypothetical protein
MSDRVVRIGGASGAWGDSPMALPQLLSAGIDYAIMDYLAEVTMSLLARARLKDPAAGFLPDFIAYLETSLPELARHGTRIVTNAGGVNPRGCGAALQAVCAKLGTPRRIAVVEGDDVLAETGRLRARGTVDAHSGAPMPARLLTANAYLGALPIAAALDKGADIVITGRCADSALALGILMHEFGWPADAYDLLAAGSLVGHILECGPQATGGIHTDWQSVPGWHDIGYPIAECRADGSFVLTKPAGTGGLVAPQVVAEQMLYEVGDPGAYLLPDVTADFRHVSLAEAGPDRVAVSGARGRAPPATYKVSATYQDGYRAVATVSIVGPDAVAKAERTAEALLARARMIFARRGLADFRATHAEVLGAEAAYGAAARARGTREVLLRLVMVHEDRAALELVAKETGAIGLSFAPGTTGIFGGRPRPTPLIRLFTFFIAKDSLPPPQVTVGDEPPFAVAIPAGTAKGGTPPEDGPAEAGAIPPGATVEMPLRALAYARSGDKGDSSNIAIIARRPEFVPLLRRELTPARMLSHFAGLAEGPVTRFEAPGVHAFNFVIERALGGGGMASLRIDPQGKAFGQMALEMTVPVPRAWIDGGLVAAPQRQPERTSP